MRWTTLLLAAGLALLGICMPSVAQDRRATTGVAQATDDEQLPPRLKVSLADVDWQPLPRGVWDAKVSPDGRLWLMVSRKTEGFSTDALRRRWEQEYREAMPQVEWGSLVMFERDAQDPEALGRAWYAPARRPFPPLVWGYDGNRWVERQAPPREEGGSGHWDLAAATVAGNRAWFFSGSHAVSFDGKAWETQELISLDPTKKNSITLRTCAGVDGDLFVWIALHPDGRARLLRWREGEWTELWAPPGRPAPQAMVPLENELLLLFSGRIHRVPFDQPVEPPESLIQDVELLADRDIRIREAATERLIEAGRPFLLHLHQFEADTHDPERRQRLRLVIAILEGGSGETGPGISRFGPFEFTNTARLHRSLDGSLRITAGQIRRGEKLHGPAELTIRPDGATQVQSLSSTEATLSYARRITELNGSDGKLIRWEDTFQSVELPPQDPRRSRQSYLFRTVGGRDVQVPVRAFRWVVAALPDGSAVLSDRAFKEAQAEQPLILYQPGKTPTSRLRGVMRQAREMRMAPDGVVWTRDRSGLCHSFDGTRWEAPLDPSHKEFARDAFLPLGDGHVLFAGTGGAAIYDGEGLIDADADVRALIARNAEILRERLWHARLAHPREAGTALSFSFDDAGNIWLGSNEQLGVLADGKWIDVVPVVHAKRPHFHRIKACIPVAGGATHYISDFSLNAQFGTSLVARLVDGKLSFRTVPHCTDSLRFDRPVYDESGALFVPIARTGNDAPDYVFAHGTLRISGWSEPDGSPARLTAFAEGEPWLFDEHSDLLWLRQTLPYRHEAAARLVAGEKTIAGVDLPGLSRVIDRKLSSFALSHRSGSVFIVTAYGLIRLMPGSPGGEAGAQYALYLPDYAPADLKDARIVGDNLLLLFSSGIVQIFELPLELAPG